LSTMLSLCSDEHVQGRRNNDDGCLSARIQESGVYVVMYLF
jgi:hypothetical protein